jgi:probable 2-oxoglutarate dehydrogenase E1 component DHKTD1
MCLWISY